MSLNRLKVKYKDGTLLYRPLDDIFSLVVDNRIATITVPLLNALSEEGITVIFCDERHMPVSFLQRLDGNYLHSGRTRCQLSASVPMQKQLWKQIVFSKIQNQSNLLTLLNLGVDPLKTYYSSIKSGDSTNREGVAARIYWKKLFGKEFTRDRYGNPPNNMLNYGYAILRANVARALIGRGLLLEIGLFHRNRFDPMPLADDMMEPFRPFVDEVVWH